MGIVIDTHVHIYDVPEPSWNTQPFTGESLIKTMDGPFNLLGKERRVDIALVQPTPGVTILQDWDFRKQHEYVIESVRKNPDRFLGVMMINPHFGLDEAFTVLDQLVKEEGFRAIKMHPSFHNYFPNKNKHLSYPIMEKARELNIPVIIHTGEPPYSVPALMAPLAKDFPDVKIMLAHFGTQKIGYSDDAINVASNHDNIYLQIDWSHLNRLKEGVETLGPERLVFASDSPYNEMGIYMRMLEVLTWDPPQGMRVKPEDLEKILGGNAAEMLGL